MTARGMDCYEPYVAGTQRNLMLIKIDRYLISLIMIALTGAYVTKVNVECLQETRYVGMNGNQLIPHTDQLPDLRLQHKAFNLSTG